MGKDGVIGGGGREDGQNPENIDVIIARPLRELSVFVFFSKVNTSSILKVRHHKKLLMFTFPFNHTQ